MNDLLLSPLGPAIVLLLAGGLLRILSSPRRPVTLALLTLAPLAGSFVLLMNPRSSGVAVYELVWWPLVVPPLRVLWALDGWNWLALTLLLIIAGCAVLLTWRLPGKRSGAYHGMSFLLLGAAALTVVSDNLLALSGAWVATDVLLIARARGSRAQTNPAPVWLEAAGSLLVLLAIGITNINIATTTLATARLPVEAVALLMLAAALRMAAYPLHLWLAPSGPVRDRGTQLLVNGLGLITGAWLAGRVFTLGAGVWLANPVWPPLLIALLLIASLAAWTVARSDRLAMLSSARASWLWLILALAPAVAGRDALGWAMTSVALGLALMAIGQSMDEQARWRLPLFLAAATLAGAPLTSGMAARALIDLPNLALLLFLVVADGLAVASVMDDRQPAPAETVVPGASTPAGALSFSPINWPLVRLLTALGLALVPNLLWGLQPASLASAADFNLSPSLAQLLQQLGLAGFIAIGLALALGAGFRQLAQQPNWALSRQRLAGAANLTWALRGVHWLLLWIAAGWRNALLIVEGEGYLGWIVLLLLLALLLVRL